MTLSRNAPVDLWLRLLVAAAALVGTPDVSLGQTGESTAPTREVDFRYAPHYWYSPTGYPDDWHKPLVNDRGALLYDFGPGPYVMPGTIVSVGLRGAELERREQGLTDWRVPVVRTVLTAAGATLTAQAFTPPPDEISISDGRFPAYERLDGITGALGWAEPNYAADSAFRNVAWGITRPIHYRVRAEPGSRKRVVLGFCESYKPRLGERIAWMAVEGAPADTVDLALTARRNDPQVFVFEAGDDDRDGWIHVEVMAPTGSDPNTTLSAIWVYPHGASFTRDQLIAGGEGAATPPELSIDAGTEFLRQPARVDVISAEVEAGREAALQVTVQSNRFLRNGGNGTLSMGNRPFVVTEPAFVAAEETAEGWVLTLPAGARSARVLVFSGDAGDEDVRQAGARSTEEMLSAITAWWAEAPVPYGRISVPDPRMQALLDGSLRTLYQSRESINGRGQFNSGYSLYRGLWAGDAIYHIDLTMQLRDQEHARETLSALLAHQSADGMFEIMRPVKFYREAAQVLWGYGRYVWLSKDLAFAERHWPDVMRGVEALRRIRNTTLGTGEPYEGLFPPAFSDGGIAAIAAEYSSVYWTLIALDELGRVAQVLGESDDAREIRQFFDGLRAAFETASRRDMRQDAYGNRYLPVPVAKAGPDEAPPLAQWAVLEAHLLADFFPQDSDLLLGTLGMLEDHERQGLPISTGWLPGGIWAGYGALYGHLQMLQGRDAKTADILYAVANHASPVGTWVEEQPLQGQNTRLAGDMPHTWHPTLLTRLAVSMLAIERGDTLHLLSALPEEWLHPGATTALDRVHTSFGEVSLKLVVAPDGRTAALEVQPIGTRGQAGRLLLHTRSLRRAGFGFAPRQDRGPDEAVPLDWGAKVKLTFAREREELR